MPTFWSFMPTFLSWFHHSLIFTYQSAFFTYQSAFRENHSTETALIKLTDELLFNMDDDKVTGMISIDFKKAFDLVNHETLLPKLQMYGLTDSAVKWFHSYLSDRQQCA